MVPSWMENPTDKDRLLLLKHQLSCCSNPRGDTNGQRQAVFNLDQERPASSQLTQVSLMLDI